MWPGSMRLVLEASYPTTISLWGYAVGLGVYIVVGGAPRRLLPPAAQRSSTCQAA
jgi:hypothetical protein